MSPTHVEYLGVKNAKPTTSELNSAKRHSYLGLDPKPSLINSSSVTLTASGSFSYTASSTNNLIISLTSEEFAFLIFGIYIIQFRKLITLSRKKEGLSAWTQ